MSNELIEIIDVVDERDIEIIPDMQKIDYQKSYAHMNEQVYRKACEQDPTLKDTCGSSQVYAFRMMLGAGQ